MVQRSPRTTSVRTSVVSVRLQPEQRRAIEDAAISSGLTVSAYIAGMLERAGQQPDEPRGTAVNNALANAEPAERAVYKAPTTKDDRHASVNMMPDDEDDAESALNLGQMLGRLSAAPVNKGFAAGPVADPFVNMGVNGTDARTVHVYKGSPDIDFSKLADSLGPTSMTMRGAAVNKPFEADPRALAIRFKPVPGGLPQAALDDLASRVGKPVPASTIDPADPAVLYELKRIGNNINQIAHAVNASLPPDANLAVNAFRHLFEALTDGEEYRRRLAALRTRKEFNGTAHP